MATKKTKICDICGKDANQTLYFSIARKMDAAGDIDDVDYGVDVCQYHYDAIIKKAKNIYGSDDIYRPGTKYWKLSIWQRKELSEWINMQIIVHLKMTGEEKGLSDAIEAL